jgi:3-hydroxyisobutyrate dehydrogenase-like beta-hydroxyacid dehydrogenase
MKRVGIIGLGDMGIGMAKNLIAGGFELTGFDLRAERLEMLKALGGIPADSLKTLAESTDFVFVMVLNGTQVMDVVAGEGGLLHSLKPGSIIDISATIEPREMRAVAEAVTAKGFDVIDSPVSGGKSGAENGTLTMMVSAKKAVYEAHQDVLKAVGEKIFHVGEEAGVGQTVKASLQALIGASFAAIFESLVLGSKAGVSGKTLYEVFGASGVSSPLFLNCAKLILDRKFKNTGSHIGTMHKDLGISMALAKEKGVAMFTTSAAYELFQSGISLFPEEDNWACVKLLEQIASTEVTW